MGQGQIKKYYERFKRWQQSPTDYEFASNEVQHCHNCGHDFTGNYCPYCSQKAGLDRINWHSVRQSMMDVWGLGTRSLLNSIWQLLLRPGYLISDYISGKRQMCFPPVKMLFILAVAYVLLFNWLFPNFEALGYAVDAKDMGFKVGDDMANMFKPFYDWYETHFSWAMLILSFIAIFPTWIMFRYSPRHTRHTLPESFFIQVLFADLQVVICILLIPCWFFLGQWTIISISSLILMLYYIVGYMQLFGYNLWGTLWRQAFVFGFVFCTAVTLATWAFDLNPAANAGIPTPSGQMLSIKSILITFYSVASIIILAIGYIINRIATRKIRKEQRQ
jgi:hypothetical protein